MNFKPNKWKVILSLIISVAIFMMAIIKTIHYTLKFRDLCSTCSYLSLISIILELSIRVILTLISVYLIFSLFQNAKFSSNKKEVVCSIIISLALLVIGALMLLGHMKSLNYISLTLNYFLINFFSLYTIVSSIALFFFVYYLWTSFKQQHYKRLSLLFITALLAVIVWIVFSQIIFLPLALVFCGFESCSDAEIFYAYALTCFVIISIGYFFASLIVRNNFSKKLQKTKNNQKTENRRQNPKL